MSLPDRPCSEAEIEAQIAYLSATPVSGLADALRVRRLRMRQGVVRSLRALGNLKTEFGELGPLIPSPMEGEPKFRIHEVVPTLRANPTADPDLLRCIEQFIEKDRRGAVVYNVTILRSVADRI